MYLYMNTTVVPTTFAHRWYGDYATMDAGLMADFQTKIVNVVRARKLIVPEVKCPNPDVAKLLNAKQCFPRWTYNNSDKSQQGVHLSMNLYAASPEQYSMNPYIESSYDTGGFTTTLGRTTYNGLFLVKYLENKRWLRNNTRAFFIEFWAFNANTELFTDVRILIERGPTKLVVATERIISTKLGLTGTIETWLCILLIVAAVVIALILLVIVLGSIFRLGMRYFLRIWAIMDITILILSIVLFVDIVIRFRIIHRFLEHVAESPRNTFILPYRVVDLTVQMRIISGCIIFLCIMRVLHLLYYVDYFRKMQYALNKAYYTVIIIIICGCIIFFGMSLCGHLRFSSESYHFSTVWRSFVCQWTMIAKVFPEVVYSLKEETGFSMLYLFAISVVAICMKVIVLIIILVNYRQCQRFMSGLRWNYSVWLYYKEFCNHYYEFITRCILRLKKKKNLRGGREEYYEEPVSPKLLKHRYENNYRIKIDKMNLMRCVLLAVIRNKVVRQGKKPGVKDFILMEEIARATYVVLHPTLKGTGGLKDPTVLYSFAVRVPNKRAHFVTDPRLLEMEAVARECVTTERAEQQKAIKQERLIMVPDLLSLGRMETMLKCLTLLDVIFDKICFDVDPKYGLKPEETDSEDDEESSVSSDTAIEDAGTYEELNK